MRATVEPFGEGFDHQPRESAAHRALKCSGAQGFRCVASLSLGAVGAVAIGWDDEMTTTDDGEEASDCDEPTVAGGCLCPSNLNGRRALNDSAPCAGVS